jgi:hypothetical protein
MKFYLVPAEGKYPQELTGTEANCRAALKIRNLKLDPKDLIHEVPVDKYGLEAYVNNLFKEINDLVLTDYSGEAPDTSDIPEATEEFFESAVLTMPTAPEQQPPQALPATLRAPTESGFQPAILEAQIEALGDAGYDGLERMDSYQELQGVGANFARGIILLCVLASGEHQLARIFQKRKKFGETRNR